MKGAHRIRGNLWAFALTAVFCLLLGWIILFKMQFSLRDLDRIRMINLIPFYYEKENAFHFSEVLMNGIAFIPLGIYLRLLKRSPKKSVLLGFAFSFALELLQFLLRIGITDITDLLMNTAGTALGVLIYAILSNIFRQTAALDKVLKILATAATAMLIALLCIFIAVNP